MTRDDIIALAQEAVIAFPNENPFDFRLCRIETVERFAVLVAAAEREACAKLAGPHLDGAIAAAIRARGER
jgi:hypothetical protein